MTSEYPEVVNYTLECLLTTGRDTWKNPGMTAYSTKHHEISYQNPKQTLLIRGENDYPEMLSIIYEELMAANPLAEQIVIEESGHTCNMEQPEKVNKAIITFFN